MKILTINNPKLKKGEKTGYLTAGIAFLPGNLSGYEVCGARTEHCFEDCLAHSTYFVRQFDNVYEARKRRTRFFFENRKAFMEQLFNQTLKFVDKAHSLGLKPAFRPNIGQDIKWEEEHPEFLEAFPMIDFYDYTKWSLFKRLKNCPPNYYLLYSFNGVNKLPCYRHLNAGYNIAVPYLDKQKATETWNKRGYKCIDGDISDLRFLDKSPRVVLLKAKGTLQGKHGHKFLSAENF